MVKPTLITVASAGKTSDEDQERLQKLKAVLKILEPRSGPSEQAVKAALFDGSADQVSRAILEHTELGLKGAEFINQILHLESSGRLARFLAVELKLRANKLVIQKEE